MTKMERRWTFFYKLAALVFLAWLKGIRIAPVSFYRNAEEQRKLYDQKKTNCDGYTKISKHQRWLAVDLGVLNDDMTDFVWDGPAYRTLGELAEKLGLAWGGRWHESGATKFNDLYHIEMPD